MQIRVGEWVVSGGVRSMNGRVSVSGRGKGKGSEWNNEGCEWGSVNRVRM